MDVRIEIERSATIPVPYSRALRLLQDVPGTIRMFPKLRKLTEVSKDTYLWELAPMGSSVANIAHEVTFASKFIVDPDQGVVRWKPVRGHGNAIIEGHWTLEDRGDKTYMVLRAWGELHRVPVPLMFRMVASPFIQGKFAALIEHYFVKLSKALGLSEGIGKAAAAR